MGPLALLEPLALQPPLPVPPALEGLPAPLEQLEGRLPVEPRLLREQEEGPVPGTGVRRGRRR